MKNEVPTLTDAYLRKLKGNGVRFEVTDKTSIGLRARISAEGEVTFALKARDASSKLQTVTLGNYPEMTLKAARDEAARVRLELKRGADPNAAKRALREAKLPKPTLGALIEEFEQFRAGTRSVWTVSGPKSQRSEARRCIERVFAGLLSKDVTTLSEQDFASAMKSYKPMRSVQGRTTSNGQVSRARSYLMPILHWAAGRKGFVQIGAGRSSRLEVIDLAHVYDPASDDPTITGDRDRVLSEDELQAVLPLLIFPAPKLPGLRVPPKEDFRPIAMRFLLFTAARREDIEEMEWRDVDLLNKVWNKPEVKTTRGPKRSQKLPLSDAAFDILRSLPTFGKALPGDRVFPNSRGGKLDNWQRIQTALMKASGTTDWHRHDLRRTAATLMMNLQVPLSTIDQILAHADPLQRENVSGAASHYLRLGKVLKNIENPQATALNVLAEALHMIEAGELK